MTCYIFFTFERITVNSGSIYFDRNDESELAVLFCQTSMSVVRNGGMTAFVIAFDIVLTQNKFGPKLVVIAV